MEKLYHFQRNLECMPVEIQFFMRFKALISVEIIPLVLETNWTLRLAVFFFISSPFPIKCSGFLIPKLEHDSFC